MGLLQPCVSTPTAEVTLGQQRALCYHAAIVWWTLSAAGVSPQLWSEHKWGLLLLNFYCLMFAFDTSYKLWQKCQKKVALIKGPCTSVFTSFPALFPCNLSHFYKSESHFVFPEGNCSHRKSGSLSSATVSLPNLKSQLLWCTCMVACIDRSLI